MGTRKRGTKLIGPDELAIQRNERERARVAAAADKPIPENPSSPAPEPPPIELPFLGARQAASVPGLAEFATQMLMAETYARIAKDAGYLSLGTSEAQAKLLILRGFEMGVAPLRALNELYLAPTEQGGLEIVEEATLIRARVATSGLGVIEPVPEKCNTQAATVRAIRHDRFGHRHAEFSYTLNDATADGLMLKRNWQSGANREALLTARATTKAARAWFSDVEGPRYTGEELGGGGGGAPRTDASVSPQSAPPPSPLPPTPASATPPAGAGQATTGGVAEASPAPVSAPVTTGSQPGVAEVDTGANTAGGPHPPVAPPPGAAAVQAEVAAPSSPPPPSEGPPAGASRQEKMAHYADVSRAMHRPWTVNVGMSRDAQPVPIITHGVKTEQITEILNYTVKGRTDFPRADEALGLVIDHLGKELSIDTQLIPPPYCFFSLTQDEAAKMLDGLAVWARSDTDADAQEPAETVIDAPPNPHDQVKDGQTHSWTQANDYLEAVLRRLAGHATRGDVVGYMARATGKEFYEMTPDELFQNAADIDRLGKNPTILKQAIDRMRVASGS